MLGGRQREKERKEKGEKKETLGNTTMHCVSRRRRALALIGNVLLTGAALKVYSSADIVVTFIQVSPAAASPQEAPECC